MVLEEGTHEPRATAAAQTPAAAAPRPLGSPAPPWASLAPPSTQRQCSPVAVVGASPSPPPRREQAPLVAPLATQQDPPRAVRAPLLLPRWRPQPRAPRPERAAPPEATGLLMVGASAAAVRAWFAAPLDLVPTPCEAPPATLATAPAVEASVFNASNPTGPFRRCSEARRVVVAEEACSECSLIRHWPRCCALARMSDVPTAPKLRALAVQCHLRQDHRTPATHASRGSPLEVSLPFQNAASHFHPRFSRPQTCVADLPALAVQPRTLTLVELPFPLVASQQFQGSEPAALVCYMEGRCWDDKSSLIEGEMSPPCMMNTATVHAALVW
mmetsp:Transcript_8236/g.18366  ORF Transcript_8236/g.18366 Transcript_8236/m.18366 type:complete len:329 (-) Transcript_8236:161-1147(-)